MNHVQLPEMPCREIVELVTEYLEGGLSVEDRTRFDAHLADCEYCAAYLEQMRQTVRLLGRLPEESLSDDAMQALRTAFRGWRQPL
jgi:anti-sigma factor RsiW